MRVRDISLGDKPLGDKTLGVALVNFNLNWRDLGEWDDFCVEYCRNQLKYILCDKLEIKYDI